MIESEITDLRQACDSMAAEVTKLTKGTGNQFTQTFLTQGLYPEFPNPKTQNREAPYPKKQIQKPQI